MTIYTITIFNKLDVDDGVYAQISHDDNYEIHEFFHLVF